MIPFRMHPIECLTDTDLYKLTMLQVFFLKYPNHQGQYRYHCRSDNDLLPYIDEIKEEIKYLCSLRFTEEEIENLRTFKFFKPEFIDYLKTFQLDYDSITIEEKDGKLFIEAKGIIIKNMLFEVYVMAIISEVYNRNVYNAVDIESGKDLLKEKVKKINDYVYSGKTFKYVDMGTRRRFSHRWQDYTIQYQKENLPSNVFLGTSNIYFGSKYKIKVYGSQAHELQSFYQSITHVKDSLSLCFDDWLDIYGSDLGTALSDTLTVDFFLDRFTPKYASLFSSVREDSTKDLGLFTDKIVNHYKSLGIDPMTKSIIFSNSLTIDKAFGINDYCEGKIPSSFGIGTHLTNDILFVKPIQSIMKLIFAGRTTDDMRSVCKLSDNPEKSMGGAQYQIDYVKKEVGLKDEHKCKGNCHE